MPFQENTKTKLQNLHGDEKMKLLTREEQEKLDEIIHNQIKEERLQEILVREKLEQGYMWISKPDRLEEE